VSFATIPTSRHPARIANTPGFVVIAGVCRPGVMVDNPDIDSRRLVMPIDRLRADLVRLREEIARTDSADVARLARLHRLAESVQHELDAENRVGDPAGLVAEFEEALSGFEARHPNLTAIVNSMLVTLGNMGV